MPNKIKLNECKRSLDVEVREVNEDDRTVEISFSSEIEGDRGGYVEILNHDSQSVRLDRLNGGGAVLVNHDINDQVGVVMSARIDDDRKGRALIKFSRSKRGEEIYQDVIDGVRKLVSVKYAIHKYEEENRSGNSDVVRITDWEPLELSIVAIPFDPDVGVGRSKDETNSKQKVHTMPEDNEEVKTTEKTQERKIEAPDIGKITQNARKDELNRINQIRSMAETHDLEALGREFIEEGNSYEDFNKRALEEIGKRNNKARVDTNHDGEVDLTAKERSSFSMFRLMDAIAHPRDRSAQERAAFELEVSDAAVEGFGSEFKARGAYIPESILERAANVTTATAGGNLVATELQAGSFIDLFRNNLVTADAGMTILSGLVGNQAIPRQTSGSALGWIAAEDGDAAEDEPTFDQVTMAPKDAALYTELTRRSTQQATPSIEGLIQRDMAMAMALGIDLAVLYGTGANGQPLGVTGQTGIGTQLFAAANPTYAELVEMLKTLKLANAYNNARFMIDPNTWAALSTTPKQGSGVEGNFILGSDGRMVGTPYSESNQITDNQVILGDFSQVLFGEWGGLEVNVDPYTHSLKGRIRYVMFKTCDVAVRQPTAFVVGASA